MKRTPLQNELLEAARSMVDVVRCDKREVYGDCHDCGSRLHATFFDSHHRQTALVECWKCGELNRVTKAD